MADFDFVIVGSGAGGATLAWRLANLNAGNILIIERGEKIPQEDRNWNPDTIFETKAYQTEEEWQDRKGKPLRPETYYNVGGNTKFYGAALQRMRSRDFETVQHWEGTSPSWPLGYETLEPYYTQAEKLYKIHGNLGEDPTEPAHSEAFPYPALHHEPRIKQTCDFLQKEGLNPFHLPLALDRDESHPDHSKCIRCSTCDPYPCKLHAKMDAETACLQPALASGKVSLWTGCKVLRAITDPSGRKVLNLEVEKDGKLMLVSSEQFILSAGAINSAALLLRSKSDKHPHGLGNKSGLVGRNLMFHNHSGVTAVGPEKNDTIFQKTLGIHDYYFRGPNHDYPLGTVQLTGKAPWQRLEDTADGNIPQPFLEYLSSYSVDWWITTEDLPKLQNRVRLDESGQIRIEFKANNLRPHRELIETWIGVLRRRGDYLFMTKTMPLATVWHQAGTCVFGKSDEASVLNLDCRIHDLDNCYVVDSSFMPSMGSVNPTLTIIANALRVGDNLAGVCADKTPISSTAVEADKPRPPARSRSKGTETEPPLGPLQTA